MIYNSHQAFLTHDDYEYLKNQLLIKRMGLREDDPDYPSKLIEAILGVPWKPETPTIVEGSAWRPPYQGPDIGGSHYDRSETSHEASNPQEPKYPGNHLLPLPRRPR